ncbi:MAG: hypothetical protein KGL39_04570 [Patescibacteria group bacterium]|nr:hypothetical protein [Patescibacteria group bacterium]
MPLIKSSSKKAIGKNIAEMEASGHPRAQSIAAALDTARRAKQHRAIGGPTWVEREFARGMTHPGGLLNSHVAGRTDHLPLNVKAGSYVIPADVVSGLGQGNTANGSMVLGRMFNLGPYGASSGPYGSAIPHLHRKRGGVVPIMAAGGEVIIPPEKIVAKFGDLDKGHKRLDEWVLHERKKHIKTLKSLPGPAKANEKQ